jgi:hypothetical protein
MAVSIVSELLAASGLGGLATGTLVDLSATAY